MKFACPFMESSVFKTDLLIPISADEKGATSILGFRPIIYLSSSLTLSGDSFRLLSLCNISPSLSIRSENANMCWL